MMVRYPKLYKIGINNTHFNNFVFWRWLFYGFWQSSLILYLAVFLSNHLSPDQTGQFAGIWVVGEFVFLSIVIVANMKILVSSYLINVGLIFTILISFLTYIFAYSMISGVFVVSNEYGTMYMMFAQTQSYFAVILVSFSFVLIDTGTFYVGKYIDKWYMKQK